MQHQRWHPLASAALQKPLLPATGPLDPPVERERVEKNERVRLGGLSFVLRVLCIWSTHSKRREYITATQPLYACRSCSTAYQSGWQIKGFWGVGRCNCSACYLNHTKVATGVVENVLRGYSKHLVLCRANLLRRMVGHHSAPAGIG